MKTKSKNEQERGITLIALVVTIVVLLILAGVSISLVLNNNGVISKSKDARDQYAEAQTNDEKQLNEVSDWIDTKVGDTTGGSDYDPATDGVTIPEKFVYVGGTKDSGIVISDNALDKEKYKGQEIVGTDLVGNQFVWIPVENISEYTRTWFKGNGWDKNYSETLSEFEKESVEKNKGYYIGRYEAGDKESTASKSNRWTTTTKENTVVVKAGQITYDKVTKTEAQSLAEGFSVKQGYTNVTSKLISSYAWDTAIAFIQKTNSDYGSNSIEGNYADTGFDYININGVSETKQKSKWLDGGGILVPTGQTTAVNNIYDMGGNVNEWTTESYNGSSKNPFVYRGGNCTDGCTRNPAGDRIYCDDTANAGQCFRITLFL